MAQFESSKRTFLKNLGKAVVGTAIGLTAAKEIGREAVLPNQPKPNPEKKKNSQPTSAQIVENFKGKYKVSSFEEMQNLATKDAIEHSFFEVKAGDETVMFYIGHGDRHFGIKFDVTKLIKQLPKGISEVTLWHTHPSTGDNESQGLEGFVGELIKEGKAVPYPIPPSHFDMETSLHDHFLFQQERPEIKLKEGVQDNNGRWRMEIDADSDLSKEELYKDYIHTHEVFSKSVTSQEHSMLKRIEDSERSGNVKERDRIRVSDQYKKYREKLAKTKTPNFEFFSGYIQQAEVEHRYAIISGWKKDGYSVSSNTKEAVGDFVKKYKEKYKATISYDVLK